MGNTKASGAFSNDLHQGKILEKLIAQKNLTPFMLAKRLNITKAALKNILSSKILTSEDITNMCSILNVESSVFFPIINTISTTMPESKLTKQPERKFDELQMRFQECLVSLLQA